MGFRITTWNALLRMQAMFDILEADIVVMQETKIQRKDLTDDMVLVPGWDVYFSLPKHKKGYSGVAIYTRNASCAPIRAEEGIMGVLCPPKSSTQFRNLPKHQQIGGYPRPGQLSGTVDEVSLDSEGRCVILEFPGFVLLGVYSPANRDESRAEFRMGFLQALDARVRNLVAEGKQVVLVGDLNVSRSASDSTNVVETLRKEGLSMEEWMNFPSRRLFNHLVYGGTVQGNRDEGREQPVLWDLCREFHPAREGMNTCWDTKRNTRPANNGSRIDYVLCSDGLKDWFTEADIQEGLMGSDHCPVFATLADVVVTAEKVRVSLLNLVNPTGVVDRDGRRLRDWRPRDVLPSSARLIPEFDRRQSIRDMFAKRAGARPPGYSSPLALQGVDASARLEEDSGGANLAESASSSSLGLSDDANGHSAKSEPLATGLGPEAPPRAKRAAGSIDRARSPSPKRNKDKGLDGGASTSLGAVGRRNVKSSSAVAKSQKTLKGFFFRPSSAKRMPEGGGSDVGSDVGADVSADVSANAGANSDALFSCAQQQQTTKPTEPTEGPPPSSHQTLLAATIAHLPLGSVDDDWPATCPGSASPMEPAPESSPNPAGTDKVFDPIQAKESWSRLLGRRMLPRCEHNEPCISLVTKKPGVNCAGKLTFATGRSFYICARPLGPSGEKEKDSEWRCGTFIWSSDWNGSPS
ncbi:family 1 AP (apurinic/apyrimidinic) endonuclease [Trichoderma cornu-damae]|uniref:DNA-(apurinic or apyrimidinic site) endonuclease 2 n=1 Tax=Trichoderma cornu-damae TaxID=654480 RepID=A0A9P8QKZ8_9HYPO|nr:family 1 AP (apurinic/apyrimidinic) endonuclease [Trichoderma cornu-damae]